MSALVTLTRSGRAERTFKYEKIITVRYTKDKQGGEQIDVTIDDGKIYTSWSLSEQDISDWKVALDRAKEEYTASLPKFYAPPTLVKKEEKKEERNVHNKRPRTTIGKAY